MRARRGPWRGRRRRRRLRRAGDQPYLLYEDVAKAIDWLCEAFGFEEVLRVPGRGRRREPRRERLGESIYLGYPGGDYRSPSGSARTALVHVYIDDVDAHYEHAKAAGAEIEREPADQPYGDRRYDVLDLEGQLWSFRRAAVRWRRRSGARRRGGGMVSRGTDRADPPEVSRQARRGGEPC